MLKLLIRTLMKKLVMNNKGFTLIEIIISLLLLAIFIVLLSGAMKLTSTISKNFLDFTDYEYGIFHKKITDIYNDSQIVTISGRTLYFENKDKDVIHAIVIRGNKIFKKTKNDNKFSIRGNSLLLNDIRDLNISFEGEKNNEIVILDIEDRMGHKRYLHLRLKNEIKEKEEIEKKNKEKLENKDIRVNEEDEKNKESEDKYE